MRLALLSITLLSCAVPNAAGQPAASESQPVVLVTKYEDGRTLHHIVTSKPQSAWTPLFARIESWRPPAGELPVTAIKYTRVLEDEGVRVDIAAMRGEPHAAETAVASVLVQRSGEVVVETLTNVGVRPVVLSLERLAPTMLYLPEIKNDTAGLEVTAVEFVDKPVPGYQVSVTNRSSKAAITFHVNTYRTEKLATTGRQGHPDGRPVIAPGGTYSFFMHGSSGASADGTGWTPLSFDVVEISAVLWDDGTIEGDGKPMASALLTYIGRRVQLARAVAVLNDAAAIPDPARAKAALRAGFDRLPVTPDVATLSEGRSRIRDLYRMSDYSLSNLIETAYRDMRTGALSDVDDAPADPAAFRRWLGELTAQYEIWLSRFTGR